MIPSGNDSLYRFVFDGLGVRGCLVHLDAGWTAVLERHDYPMALIPHLGELSAAAVLLSAILKLRGSLILQAQGPGPVTALIAQATHDRHFRSIARWSYEPGEDKEALTELTGEGHLALTIEPIGGERYQGVVGLEGERIQDAIEQYFEQSEQLPTLIRLAADSRRAVGLLIQILPSVRHEEEDWNRIGLLTGSVRREELLGLSPNELLHRLYHEEKIRLFDPEPVAFRCTCSREKVGEALRALGQAELQVMLGGEGLIETTCEFCNRKYSFDAVDIEQLLGPAPGHIAPNSTQ
ncbi:MAG: Hsp33 family molecular chaperone HslO [Gammaproteobacteria bacterium]|nr:Hsp33 family molecular chaperone HslO [Gammaproteobacteria bacterium]MBU1654720.1 Hsp33 family molecular chaperone HslO [Gammaproteobacteria bacterium]MBU1959641.1 Hsp33 family molecular chaperone HslO [Gammaproteobacteria bacterium]